jgi:hypothetical protein
MVNYQLGKVYKIISDDFNKIYIGSTCCKYLCMRFAIHMLDYNTWKKNPEKYRRKRTSSFKILKYNNCKIILIENYPCNSKDELISREQYWIDKNKDICINMKRAKCINKKECQKEYHKKHYYKNKNKIIEANNKYYKNNREKVLERMAEKHLCIYCNENIAHHNFPRHLRTKKHIENEKFFDSL